VESHPKPIQDTGKITGIEKIFVKKVVVALIRALLIAKPRKVEGFQFGENLRVCPAFIQEFQETPVETFH
jgi:hypothetical protein